MAMVASANTRSFERAKIALEKAIQINKDYFKDKWETEIWWRTFRPDDFNPAMNPVNRNYTTNVARANTRLFGSLATTTVPADTLMVIYGWNIVPEVGGNFSSQALLQVWVNGNLKHEALPILAEKTEDGFLLMTEQTIVLKPNDRVDIWIRDPILVVPAVTPALIVPIGTYSEIVSRAANL